MNIEDLLNPNHSKLIEAEECFKAQIFDAEVDPIDCVFHCDDSVQIKTEDYSYITLTRENLETLINLIDESERIYFSKL